MEENDDEQIIVSDLCRKMQESLGGAEPYSIRYMKSKLCKTLGERVLISYINGKLDVVTFRETADKILDQFFRTPQDTDPHTTKVRIIETAARLMLSDTKSQTTDKNEYPSHDTIASLENSLEFLPESMKIFLQTYFHSNKNTDLKLCSLGHALVQCVRPKSILSPLQIGLAVQLHHMYGSRYLIDHLSSLGFCSGYKEVKRYEQCAATTQLTDIFWRNF